MQAKIVGSGVQRLGTLAILTVGLLWSYWPTFCALAARWAADPQYSHGFLVPIFAGVILWLRPADPTDTTPPFTWWGIPVLLIAAALNAIGAGYYFEWVESMSLLPALCGVTLLVAGTAGLRRAWPAIGFLLFMVPLPFFAETALAQPLQRMATSASTYALQTFGLPALAEGNIIRIDDFRLGVLEACNGLGMLMAFLALSTAVAIITQRPWQHKLVIVISAVPIAVVANVGRITATGVLYRLMGNEAARLLFHDLAGWLMMPFALALVWGELALLDRLFIDSEASGPVPLLPNRLNEGNLSVNEGLRTPPRGSGPVCATWTSSLGSGVQHSDA